MIASSGDGDVRDERDVGAEVLLERTAIERVVQRDDLGVAAIEDQKDMASSIVVIADRDMIEAVERHRPVTSSDELDVPDDDVERGCGKAEDEGHVRADQAMLRIVARADRFDAREMIRRGLHGGDDEVRHGEHRSPARRGARS